MKIGIVGSGRIGGSLGKLFAEAGHEVMLSSRHPERLRDEAEAIGATAGSIAEAAEFGEVVIFSAPWRTRDEALPQMEATAGKIVIDTSNPYSTSGEVQDLGEDTSSEAVARGLPGARVVKAFNTIFWEHLRSQGKAEHVGRRALPISGDDPDAKKVVAQLIDDIGYDALDVGSLADGRKQQPGMPLYYDKLTLEEAEKVLRG